MRYALSIIAVIVLVVIAIIIIATTGGHHGTKAPIASPINLTHFNTPTSSVSQTTYGPLVAEGQRQGLEITVSQGQVNVYALSGYESTTTNIYSAPNTPSAYGVFLAALQNYGFADSRSTNERYSYATCPLGNTYRYQLNNVTGKTTNLWSDSCSSKDGTFVGYGSSLRQLFQLQVTGYNNLPGVTNFPILNPSN